MCDMKNRDALRNGHAADQATQGHALADILDAVSDIQKLLGQIPTRHEVREMIGEAMKTHVRTCAAARDGKPSEPDKFKVGIGKFFGLEAQGSRGVLFGALIGGGAAWLLFEVAPHIEAWLGAALAR